MRKDWGVVVYFELGVQIFLKLWYLTLFIVFWCVAQSLGEYVFLICVVLVKLTFPTH